MLIALYFIYSVLIVGAIVVVAIFLAKLAQAIFTNSAKPTKNVFQRLTHKTEKTKYLRKYIYELYRLQKVKEGLDDRKLTIQDLIKLEGEFDLLLDEERESLPQIDKEWELEKEKLNNALRKKEEREKKK